MKEAIEGKIEIKDVQHNIFKALLEYIYTNQLPRLKAAVSIKSLDSTNTRSDIIFAGHVGSAQAG